MLAPNPTAIAPTWPIAGDVPDLLTIVSDQAATIAASEALLHAYQGVLSAAQGSGAVIASATGTATGASLTVSSVNGTIAIGSVVTSTSLIPAGTTILGQISGTTGGAGVYLTSAPTTVSATAVAFSNGATATGTASGTSLTLSAVTGTIVNGSVVTSTALVPNKTTIAAQTSGVTGGNGVYTTSAPTTVSGTPLSFALPAETGGWPTLRDQDTLNSLTQIQTAVTRTQNALIQHYQDLLNMSQTPVPPTGP